MACGHQDACLQLLLAEIVRGINDGSFIFAQLFVQQKGVVPLKARLHDVNPSKIKEVLILSLCEMFYGAAPFETCLTGDIDLLLNGSLVMIRRI
jgi:hypothetical protein